MCRIISAAVIAVAAMTFNLSPARAYVAPWCAVINLGTGSVYWDCQYQTLEACVPNVLAGNRGFCNPNPSYSGDTRPTKRYVRRHRHRAVD
jgi:uncharacterized protein DUF3551